MAVPGLVASKVTRWAVGAAVMLLSLPGTVWAQAAGNPIVSPIETHTTTTVNLVAPPPDPQAIADASVQSTQAVILQVAAPIPVAWDNQLFNLPDLWRTTPPSLTYENGPLRNLAGVIQTAALALLVLAIVIVALGHMLRQGAAYGRIIYAIARVVGNLYFWELGIRLNNALCAAIGAPDLPGLIRPHIGLSTNVGQQAGDIVLVIVYSVIALLVMLGYLFRLGLLQILMVIGALPAICKATDQSDHFDSRYTALSAGLLFSQVLMTIGLKVAEVDAVIGTGISATLMALVVLLTVRRLPGLMMSAGNTGGSGFARIVSMVITRRISRAVS